MSLALIILRIGLGLTFLITSYFIFKNPNKWAGLILPWAKKLLPLNPKTAIILTAYYDVANGLWLISGVFLFWAALIASIHLIQVIITVGITDAEYRDIGLLAACIALMLLSIH